MFEVINIYAFVKILLQNDLLSKAQYISYVKFNNFFNITCYIVFE